MIRVRQAIRDSLELRRPSILTTDCPETHQALYGVLAGVCDGVHAPGRDGTSRFFGTDGDRTWDVRLRLRTQAPRASSRPALRILAEYAQRELSEAMAGYMRERSVQAATAVGLAIVNCEQARADAIDAGEPLKG